MKYCTRCVMPDTRPGEWQKIPEPFDENGVCLACRNYDSRKDIGWDARFNELEKLADLYRRKDGAYDCLVPVSGGKDSHYIVYIMKEILGMNPLLVNVWDPFTHTKAGIENLRNISNTFNCDIFQFRISENLFRRAVRSNFEEFGHPLILVEAAIYTVPFKLAIDTSIPFLVQGENPNYEYGTEAIDQSTSSNHIKQVMQAVDLKFWTDRGFSKCELNLILPPSSDKAKSIFPIFLSYYVPWIGWEHYKVAKRYGFRDLTHEWIREGNIESYDQIDTIGWLMALWLKWPKFGFSRATDIACRWIREGKVTREEAIVLVKNHDHILDQNVLDDFLAFTGYSIREFWDIVERFWNRDIFEKVNGIWKKKPECELK